MESTISSNTTQKTNSEEVELEKHSLTEYYEKLQSLENDLMLSRQSLSHLKSGVSTIKTILNSMDFQNLQNQMEKSLDNTQILSVDNPEKFANLLHLSSNLFCNIENYTIDSGLPKQLINGLEKINNKVEKLHRQASEIEKNFIQS